MSRIPKTKETVLIIGLIWPEPSATAAGIRMLQLITFFKKNQYQIVFASTAATVALSADFDALHIKKRPIALNHTSFDDFIIDLKPAIVLFDRFITEEQFGWRVMKYAPNAIRILDTEDLHSLRQTREKAYREQTDFTNAQWLKNPLTKREMASIYRSDITLVISTFEMELLEKEIKMNVGLLMHLPFMFNAAEIKTKPYKDRRDFMFIGNGKHTPNVDAIKWLYNDIWPLIRKKLPEANLMIYGAYLPQSITQLHRTKSGFHIKGWIENAADAFLAAKVNIAPLRFGAGIKGKLLDAMKYGTPSVTTTIGAEGMHGALPWNGYIKNDAASLAAAAVALYTDQKEWEISKNNGFSILSQLYDEERLSKTFLARIHTLKENLQSHRANNFIGSMLHHHTMASTKYLSKWIAEKNKET